MTKVLAVYLEQKFVGLLQQDKHGRNSFSYDLAYLSSDNPKPISQIMPLRTEKYDQNTCHAFFAGILPEDHQRKLVARCLGITANNDFSLLEKIGGECAGAISILPADTQYVGEDYAYRELLPTELAEVLDQLPRRPLLAGEEGIRLSLAGVQDKLPVAIFDNKIQIPLNGAPSTHILKPQISGYEFNTVTNEAYCLKLAKKIGLHVAECSIGITGTHQYLLVERYDRIMSNNNKLQRLHQEDFCQALGIAPERKYQNEGGPSLGACFNILREASTDVAFDIPRLLDAVIFNYIIGNCDAHGKNFSFLYKGNTTRLAPLYDLLSTIIYPELSNKMAMKIGKEYQINKINKDCFIKLAQDANLNAPLMFDRIKELCAAVRKNFELEEFSKIDTDILYTTLIARATNISTTL